MGGRGRTRAQKPTAPTANMPSAPVPLPSNLLPENRQIPLLCFVCPETPKFSDVSHLLTHIASKGHLHHETQTKLRAHQDIAAAFALQQYEQWYRDFEIETLLVERLRAKQVKEAARSRRTVQPTSFRAPQTDHQLSRVSSFDELIKVEDDFYPDFPLLPSLFPPNFDPDMTVEHVTGPDMMALKGQVWPGMGKMDLANDEMKRTRNQRKPKSVIERMRRASQGIEPTEVVMSTDLEVERTRGVYDKTSSPEPDQSDMSEKKPRPRRKRPAALTEISTNVPRGTGIASLSAKAAKPAPRQRQTRHRGSNEVSGVMPSFQPTQQSQQMFNDGDDTIGPGAWSDEPSIRSAHTLGSFPYATFGTPHGANRFHIRDRHPFHSLNPFSLTSGGSPTLLTKHGGNETTSASGRISTRAQTIEDHDLVTEPFPTQSTSFSPNPPTRSNDSTRFAPLSHPSQPGHAEDSYNDQSDRLQRLKQEHVGLSDGPFRSSASHQFLSVTGRNPLFSRGHGLPDLGSRTMARNTPSPLGFLPMNRDRDRTHFDSHDDGQNITAERPVKIEGKSAAPDICLDSSGAFLDRPIWDDTEGQQCDN